MGRLKFIRGVLAKCESLRPGVIAYAYQNGNVSKTHVWMEVCVSDLDMYFRDERFRKLTQVWYRVAARMGLGLIFCYCNPKEEKLASLAEQNNLIMNI